MSATNTIELTAVTAKEAPTAEGHDARQTGLADSASPVAAVVEKKGTTAVIITTIAGVTMISSLLSGIVTISLPVMAKDLEISQALLLW